MKKYAIIMIIGAAVIAINISVSADEAKPIQRIDSVEVGSEDGIIDEAIIEEVSEDEITDDLIIAPNPDATITHDAEKGERTIDEQVISPEPYDGENIEEMIDSEAALIAVGTGDGQEKTNSAIPVILVLGAAAVILIALIAIRRNQK